MALKITEHLSSPFDNDVPAGFEDVPEDQRTEFAWIERFSDGAVAYSSEKSSDLFKDGKEIDSCYKTCFNGAGKKYADLTIDGVPPDTVERPMNRQEWDEWSKWNEERF